MTLYLTLALEFFKIGLFSVGGGLATLPFLYGLVDKYDWFTREMLIDMIAVSESTPGPIGINMATYAGFSAGGAAGGIIATIALITPSIIIMLVITRILAYFKENRFVKYAFYGIRPAVTALIASAAFGIIRITLLDFKAVALFAVTYYLLVKFNKHPVCYIGGAALAGAVLSL